MIRDYILNLLGEKPSIDDIVASIKDGRLRIVNSEDIMYSLPEVAEMFNVATRTVFRWGQEGKVNIVQTDVGKAISSAEVDRLYQTLPTPKQNTCVYYSCKGDMSEANDKINKLLDSLKLNRYRVQIFIDIDGKTGLLDLIRHCLRNRCTLFTNTDLSVEVLTMLNELGVKVFKF